MHGMILAAGLGTRLRPLTSQTPKPLVKLAGRPLITYSLDSLAQAGVQKVAINTHYLAEQIPAALGERYRGMSLHYLYEPDILGTGGGLKNACDQVLGFDRPILLMNSDIALEFDVDAFVQAHETRRPAATLLLKTIDHRPGFVEIGTDAEGWVRGITGKVPYAGPPLFERLFCGTHLISPDALKTLKQDGCFSIIDGFYVPLLKSGASIWGAEQKGAYFDLGTLESLKEAEAFQRLSRA
ncbi:MAG: nucleotidyltransferase family protein [Myxococcaceae bacterium]|nr:nucleotidyltransferase family protein [Myxococcaceae bacterium]MBH2006414.1 nucleotidyltransferase family protein [Myxococcaceae bacterium]